MIPILSGIIAGQGHKASHARGFVLAMAYVLGMAVTYAAAGVAAGLTGTLLAAALQNPWVLGGFALVFVVLSLSMFGFYLSCSCRSRCKASCRRNPATCRAGAARRLPDGRPVGADRRPLRGRAAGRRAALHRPDRRRGARRHGAVRMALGMGAPLVAVGIAGGSLLPKTGPWMEGVKKAFGVLLLATARVAGVAGVCHRCRYAGLGRAADRLGDLPPRPRPAAAARRVGWPRFSKGVGVLVLLAGAALFVGALAGCRDPLQPLAVLRGRPPGAGEGSQAGSAGGFARPALESRHSTQSR